MLDCMLEVCHLLCFKDTLQVLAITNIISPILQGLGDFHWNCSHKTASVYP